MKINVFIFLYFVNQSFGSVVLYNETGLHISENVFHAYSDINTSDFSTIAIRHHIRSYAESSLIECGMFCKRESRCEYFHFEEKDNTCTLLDLTQTDKRIDGIYDCPASYLLFRHDQINVCFSIIPQTLTRNVGASWCTSRDGNLAMLIKDDKHTLGASIGKSIYLTQSKIVWIDAMFNTSNQKWYWSNGAQVDETRFDSSSTHFITRDRSTPCVAFLSDKYVPYDCASTPGYTLCETDMYKI